MANDLAEAAACLSRAELAGEIVRHSDRYYPAPNSVGRDAGR